MTAPQYDVFICHASEDKEPFVRDLKAALEGTGLKAWIDEGELVLGARLRQTIDRGLSHSRFAVIVLSQHFFSKRWPQQELDGSFLWKQRTAATGYSPSGMAYHTPTWPATHRCSLTAWL